jgi:hypothetical protein
MPANLPIRARWFPGNGTATKRTPPILVDAGCHSSGHLACGKTAPRGCGPPAGAGVECLRGIGGRGASNGEAKMARCHGPWGVTAVVCTVLASACGVLLSRERVPLQPYGTDAEIRQCVADTEASLHGRSILGPRGTAEYIQSLGILRARRIREYDLMVDRCRSMFYHRYSGSFERRP